MRMFSMYSIYVFLVYALWYELYYKLSFAGVIKKTITNIKTIRVIIDSHLSLKKTAKSCFEINYNW